MVNWTILGFGLTVDETVFEDCDVFLFFACRLQINTKLVIDRDEIQQSHFLSEEHVCNTLLLIFVGGEMATLVALIVRAASDIREDGGSCTVD